MKKYWLLALLPIVVVFWNIVDRFAASYGPPYWYQMLALIMSYIPWILLIFLCSLAAFGLQYLACNRTHNILLRLLPTAAVLGIIAMEWYRPWFGLLFTQLSDFLLMPNWIILPFVLLGLLAGWLINPKRGADI